MCSQVLEPSSRCPPQCEVPECPRASQVQTDLPQGFSLCMLTATGKDDMLSEIGGTGAVHKVCALRFAQNLGLQLPLIVVEPLF